MENLNLKEIDILRISLIDDEDFSLLQDLLNQPLQKSLNNDLKENLRKKVKLAKKNISKIHNKIPDAKITNIRSGNQ